MRVDHVELASLTQQAEVVAANAGNGNQVGGVLVAKANGLRAIKNEDGIRHLCVFDDPTESNPAHATALRSDNQSEDDIKEIRSVLMDLFLPLMPLAQVYQ